VAAAVVGAGVFASVDDAPVLVQGAAAITLLLWLAAAWNFMRAVSIQPVLGGIKHEGGPEVLAEEAIQRTWWERKAIAEQSFHAQKTARVAGIATFLTVVLVLVQSNVPGSDRWWQQVWFGAPTDYGRVSLSAAGLKHYTTLCGDRAQSGVRRGRHGRSNGGLRPTHGRALRRRATRAPVAQAGHYRC
jgi:hypothetical protein